MDTRELAFTITVSGVQDVLSAINYSLGKRALDTDTEKRLKKLKLYLESRVDSIAEFPVPKQVKII